MGSKITAKQLAHMSNRSLRKLRKRNRKAIEKLGYIPQAYNEYK